MGLSLARTGRIKYLKCWSTVTPIFQNVDLFNLKYFIKYVPFKSKMKEKYAKLVCHIWIFRQFSSVKKKKKSFLFHVHFDALKILRSVSIHEHESE